MSTVLLTGATGFIAKHIIKALIDDGYTVVGTARSAEKGDVLVERFGSKFSYEVVTDITKAHAFDDLVKNHPEAEAFLHTASPVTVASDDPETNVIVPAINGTVSALQAVKEFGPQIKRFVMTSSYAAILDLNADSKTVLNEDSWNPLGRNDANGSGILGYCISKTYAEKAVWEFMESQKPNFTVNYINPVYVFGPQVFPEDAKTANLGADFLAALLNLKPTDQVPQFTGNFIDVRDVARAHVTAMTTDLVNQRFLLSEASFNAQSLLNIINANFDLKLPVGVPENDKAGLENEATIDNSKTKKVMGPFIQLEKSIKDTVSQLV